MSRFTFKVKTAHDLLAKLERDVQGFLEDDLASDKAILTTLIAWHMSDWVYHAHVKGQVGQSLEQYQWHLSNEHLCFKILEDLSNSIKHLHLVRPTSVAEATHKGGDYNDDFSDDFAIGYLIVTLEDGSEHRIADILSEALVYWKAHVNDATSVHRLGQLSIPNRPITSALSIVTSFSITTSSTLLDVLEKRFQDYVKGDPMSTIALDCALLAWHLSDWVFSEANRSSYSNTKRKAYQRKLTEGHRFFAMVHAVANGTKHLHLQKTTVADTQAVDGSHDRSHDNSHEIDHLVVKLEDGTQLHFVHELSNTIQFWRGCLGGYGPCE